MSARSSELMSDSRRYQLQLETVQKKLNASLRHSESRAESDERTIRQLRCKVIDLEELKKELSGVQETSSQM